MIEWIQHVPLLYRFWAWHNKLIDFFMFEVQRVYLTLARMANMQGLLVQKQMHFSWQMQKPDLINRLVLNCVPCLEDQFKLILLLLHPFWNTVMFYASKVSDLKKLAILEISKHEIFFCLRSFKAIANLTKWPDPVVKDSPNIQCLWLRLTE